MSKQIKWVLLLMGCWLTLTVYGQDPQFSQFYSAPIYLNPAFTGNTTQGRMVLNYRNQWPAIPGAFISYAASYDYNLDNVNSGLGLAVQHDKAGSAGLRYTNAAALYAYRLRINRKQAIRFGMNFSYTMRDLDFSELLFGDQLISGAASSSTSSQYRGQVVSYADIGSGAIYYTRSLWVGFSAHHLNQPNQSLLGGESRLPIKTSLHAGYSFVLKKDRKRNPISTLIIAGNYKSQLKWDQYDMGAYFNYGLFVTGIWYRGIPFKRLEPLIQNNEAFVVLAGVKWNDFRFGYSYDLTVSRLVTNSGGAHEISLIYEHASASNKRKKSRSRFLVPCAKF